MKRTSWEIVLAGIFCLGMAIYVVSSNSESEPETNIHSSRVSDSLRIQLEDKQINLELENLEQLKHLEELKQLENLENLESLKSVASFLPAELKEDFIKEINAAIEEYEQEEVSISVNTEDGSITVGRSKDIASGMWTAVSPGVFAYMKEFNTSDLKNASLTLPYGSINIVGTEDGTGKISLEASGQISNRNDLTSKLKVTDTIDEGRATFNVQRNNSSGKENIHLQATLHIPMQTAVQLSTQAGHITSSHLNGNQEYKTGGGHVTLSDLKGEIKASTSGGHIELKNTTGSINLESLGGHIRVLDCTGKIFMKTSGGNLFAQNIEGDIQAKTNGGNIELLFSSIAGDANATTGAGTIILMVPVSANADIDLSGTSIDIDPAFSFTGEKTKSSAEGQLGSGGETDISAKTNYGKVILKKNDQKTRPSSD